MYAGVFIHYILLQVSDAIYTFIVFCVGGSKGSIVL